MAKATVNLECAFRPSFRTAAIAAMFDVKPEEKLRQTFEVEIPEPDETYQIAAIIGPSGSGKSSLARHIFGDNLYSPTGWPDGAMIDGFPKGVSMDAITQTLTAVGFSSPPSWLRPYSVLSNGEKSRADLARALLLGRDVVVFDEFTSVVDRNIARNMSVAVAKQIRAGNIRQKFVAVTCHHDVVDYLQPDWVIDMSTKTLARGLLRPRPKFNLEIVRCKNAAWELFAPYHYLTATLHQSCQSYMAIVDGQPAGFCALLHVMGFAGQWRLSRTVVLPDYQGLGIGGRLSDWCAAKKMSEGAKSVRRQHSHPSLINHCKNSPLWRHTGTKEAGNPRQVGARKNEHRNMVASTGRPIASFEYIGPKETPNA